MVAFGLSSPAFDHDADLPLQFTQEGDEISPPLAWEGIPEGTKELVVICEDRDSEEGVVTHWVVYGIIPDETAALPQDLGDQALVQQEGFELYQGLNEFDNSGWTGPVATEERGPHRLFFLLHAMDAELDALSPGATRAELREAAKGHILATAELVGIA